MLWCSEEKKQKSLTEWCKAVEDASSPQEPQRSQTPAASGVSRDKEGEGNGISSDSVKQHNFPVMLDSRSGKGFKINFQVLNSLEIK